MKDIGLICIVLLFVSCGKEKKKDLVTNQSNENIKEKIEHTVADVSKEIDKTLEKKLYTYIRKPSDSIFYIENDTSKK